MAHRYQISTRREPNGSWEPERQLAQALAEREQFLARHPQYREFQQEIDEVLDKAGSSENRMAVLALLMESKLIELHGELKRLNRILLAARER